MNLNEAAPLGVQEDRYDGYVFFCINCSLYSPELDKESRCKKCGQLIDKKLKPIFFKESVRLKYK